LGPDDQTPKNAEIVAPFFAFFGSSVSNIFKRLSGTKRSFLSSNNWRGSQCVVKVFPPDSFMLQTIIHFDDEFLMAALESTKGFHLDLLGDGHFNRPE